MHRTLAYFNSHSANFEPKPHYVLQRSLAFPEIATNQKWYVSEECYDCERYSLCICPGHETTEQIMDRSKFNKLTEITANSIVSDIDGETKLELKYVPPTLLNYARVEPLPNFKMAAKAVTEI
jgi:hypothetical protein